MKYAGLFLFLFLQIHSYAQLESANWYFGTNGGITFINGAPEPLTGGLISTSEGCSSISDALGNLLFYTDGITVWDHTHAVMPNGSGLLGGASSTQSSIVIPDPGGDASVYYLFTAPEEGSGNPVAYSIVDMDMNGGNGDITSTKNVPLFSPATEKLTAVYHDNATDVWVIGHELNTNNFRAYLVTDQGVSNTPVVSSVGVSYDVEIGYLKASPCGDRIAAAVWENDFIDLFDFNDATGVVSNYANLMNWGGSASSGVYGVEFSPDGSKLYASIITPGIVVQWDMLAGSSSAIIASMDTIGTSPVNFNGALQTGPDANIYLVKLGSNTLDAITEPNLAGLACNYIQDYVTMAGSGALGLPDFFSSFFCNINSAHTPQPPNILSVFPNPADEVIHIILPSDVSGKEIQLQVFNAIGQLVYTSAVGKLQTQSEITLPVDGWNSGNYFLRITAGKQHYSEVLTVM